ncbi:hypothetical protein EV207_15013 [Scopulibacillus darangshiensis]|uniref:Uncharacterized protein n=1 Tax=Scopulibacillus darangshiensis TaxID=442528 RepID=A0A4R2NHC8_9BACL|nr:hypothetical protein [Scopulibacillus darangshiensis]TCP20710.1 hypothetical protein EV207_15013 [Scopulibacillus darangshiensis]
MGNLFLLDFDYFADKLLTDAERNILNMIRISLYIDSGKPRLHKVSYSISNLSAEQIIKQNFVLRRFMDKLNKDDEILSLQEKLKIPM